MVEEVAGGTGPKRVIVGFKEINVLEKSLSPVQLLERVGLDPLEYELRFPNTEEPINSGEILKIKDGMKLDAAVKPR
ncbi:MAG TPA: hypothetical protein VHA09_09720 [Nitrososphaera sp.]|nr:hypothetical protein [Nitrososphaera sp.]